MPTNNESATALLRHLLGPELGCMLPLKGLPQKHQEIELKYILGSGERCVREQASFLAQVCTFIKDTENIPVTLATEFVGIDEYYKVTYNGTALTFRVRLGANKPLELAVKFQLERPGIEHRGEITLKLAGNDAETVRFLVSVLAHADPQSKVFAITQRGMIWHLDDPRGALEIVCYTVERAHDASDARVFCELEALRWKNPTEALALVRAYEQQFDLSDKVCTESVAELYAP